MDPQLRSSDAAGTSRTNRLGAMEVVGKVSRVRQAECSGGSRRLIPFPHLTCSGLGHVGRRCLRCVLEKEQSQPSASRQRLFREGRI